MTADPRSTLTARQLNRAILARQFLIDQVAKPIPRVLDGMGGLQAQYAPSMYIGLWTRMAAFERDDLTHALEAKRVVQATIMRATIHLVAAGDYWPLTLAIREERRIWWMRVTKTSDAAPLEAAARTLRTRLSTDGALSRKEIEAITPGIGVAALGMFVDLVRVPPSGTWDRRRADLFALADDWLGPPPAGLGVDAARVQLVKRYLTGFGPATVAEIADWAQLRPADIQGAVADLKLRKFCTEDGAELLDLPRAPLPDGDTPVPVRFLPTFDATLLVHCRRAGIVRETDRPRIFNTKMPQSIGTFLVDGTVAGTWRYDKGAVRTESFGKLDAATKRAVATEAERLGELHA